MKIFIFALLLLVAILVVSQTQAQNCETSLDCPQNHTCQDGLCVENNTEKEPITTIPSNGGNNIIVDTPNEKINCTDSDGGINYYEEGFVSIGDSKQNDFCEDKYNLAEMYCGGDSEDDYYNHPPASYDCESENKTCFNNKCVNQEEFEKSSDCFDTDGGKNYDIKGFVAYDDFYNEDVCYGYVSLIEGYCDNVDGKTVRRQETVTCENGYCNEGKCVEFNENYQSYDYKTYEADNVNHTLKILPDVTVSFPDINYNKQFNGHKIYASIDPHDYNEKRKHEYTDEKFYSRDEWRMIQDTDPILCYLEAKDSSGHDIYANFQLIVEKSNGIRYETPIKLSETGKDGKCMDTGSTWKTDLVKLFDPETYYNKIDSGTKTCYATFPSHAELSNYLSQGEKFRCLASVSDSNGLDLKATSSESRIARFNFHIIPDGEDNFGNFQEQKNFFLFMTNDGGGLSPVNPMSAPLSKTSKFVYYLPKTLSYNPSPYYYYNVRDRIGKGGLSLEATRYFVLISNNLILSYRVYSNTHNTIGFATGAGQNIVLDPTVAEIYPFAHEMGHASQYGLCDEYNKQYWISSGGDEVCGPKHGYTYPACCTEADNYKCGNGTKGNCWGMPLSYPQTKSIGRPYSIMGIYGSAQSSDFYYPNPTGCPLRNC